MAARRRERRVSRVFSERIGEMLEGRVGKARVEYDGCPPPATSKKKKKKKKTKSAERKEKEGKIVRKVGGRKENQLFACRRVVVCVCM